MDIVEIQCNECKTVFFVELKEGYIECPKCGMRDYVTLE